MVGIEARGVHAVSACARMAAGAVGDRRARVLVQQVMNELIVSVECLSRVSRALMSV